MRKTKFRGKVIGKQEELEAMGVIDKNGWATGNLIQNEQHTMIVGDLLEFDDEDMMCDWWVPVIPESVGQYTGMKDMDREVIYEGDIGYNYHEEVHGLVKFDGGGFVYDWENVSENLFEVADEIEIVGNVIDNPDLLEVNK